jgi:hypothetical protein
VITAVICFLVYECNHELKNKREHLEGIWMIEGLSQPYLITLSTSYGQKSGQTSHIRLIDPTTGKILHSQSFQRDSWSGDDIKCMTATSIWIDRKEEWLCLDFPSLKKRWNQKSFFSYLRKTHPEMGDPFSLKLIGSQFSITNTAGKDFWLSVRDIEDHSSNPAFCFIFNENNQLGKNTYYTTPETKFLQSEGITISVEESEHRKNYNWKFMNIHEKLMADTGFAKNYAVFAPDSGCYFFDGNHSRIAYKLVDDSLELIWKPTFDKREWLEGDFLRPYKDDYMANNRQIVTKDHLAFVHYYTSLDKNENKIKLAGVDLKSEQVLWDVDLTSFKIKSGCRPKHCLVFNDLLIIVWINAARQAVILGIEVSTGSVKWSLLK